MKRRVLFLLITGMALAMGQSLYAQQPAFYANPVIADIRFQGLMNSQPSELMGIIRLKVGANFDETALNRSLKTLYALDKFSDAKADVTESTNGLIVTFILKENPLIRKVTIEGTTGFRRSDIADLVTIPENSYFTEAKMNKTIQAIIDKYENDGFVEVTVTNELVPVDEAKNIYDLVIKVKEGNKIVVEQIYVAGTMNISSADVRAIMQTKEKVFILQSGVLKPEAFLQDRSRIMQLYQQRGYLDMNIVQYEWQIEELGEGDKAHKAIVVYIGIEEGRQYTTGSISITNNVIFGTDELMKYIPLKEGDVYDAIKMEYAKYQIYNRYSDQGHLYANVSLIQDKDPTNHVVNTEIVIYEGPRAHIETITITGNDKTKRVVISRELLFREGELYIQRKVRQSYEKLVYLQYFSDIQFIPGPGSAEGLINLNIQVAEQRTGLITMGVGYGTESGLNASGTVSEKNLFGTGRTLSFKGEYGVYRQLVELSFQEPWLFQTPTFFNISFSFSRYLYDNVPTDDNGDGIIDNTTNSFNYVDNPTTELDDYESTNKYYKLNFSTGFSISRNFLIYCSSFISYTFSMYRYMDATFTTPLIYDDEWQVNTDLIEALQREWTRKHTVGLGFSFNNADSPINPLHGLSFDMNAYYIGGVFGGDISYIRPKLSLSWYWNPFWKIVLALHASTDFMLPQFDGTFKYDTADMLYFDGVYEMRGWQNYAKYGEAKVFYSSELRFQIYGQELWGLLFADLGNLWGSHESWSFDSYGYLYSFGIGVKINIPQLPIRLYLARKGYYDSDLQQWQLQGSQEFFENWQIVFSIQGLF